MKSHLAVLISLCSLAVGPALDAEFANPTAPPTIGLTVGEKAPAFSAVDQFGHEQSNETLKGADGTILLFFRSADW